MAGAYVRGEGGGIGEDAMEAGFGRDAPGKHEAEDEEDAQLSRSCAGLLRVYLRKMRGVRALIDSAQPQSAPRRRASQEPCGSAVLR